MWNAPEVVRVSVGKLSFKSLTIDSTELCQSGRLSGAQIR